MVAAHIRALCQEPEDYAIETMVEMAFTDVTHTSQDSKCLDRGPMNRMKGPAVGIDLFELIVQSSRLGEGAKGTGETPGAVTVIGTRDSNDSTGASDTADRNYVEGTTCAGMSVPAFSEVLGARCSAHGGNRRSAETLVKAPADGAAAVTGTSDSSDSSDSTDVSHVRGVKEVGLRLCTRPGPVVPGERSRSAGSRNWPCRRRGTAGEWVDGQTRETPDTFTPVGGGSSP